MADVDVTIGLDYSRYKAGLREVDASTARSAKSIETQLRNAMKLGGAALGVNLLAKAWHGALSAVREYGKENERAQRVAERWDSTYSAVVSGIGATIVDYVDAITSGIDRLAGGVGEAKLNDRDGMASFKKMREGIQARRAYREELSKDLDRSNNAQLRRQGDGFLADNNESNQLARDRQARLELQDSLDAQQKAGYARIIESYRRADIRRNAEDAISTQQDAVERARRSIGSRSLEAGAGGDAFVRGGVFNKAFAQYDPVKEELGKLRRVEEETKKVLDKIERNTADRLAAVAG